MSTSTKILALILTLPLYIGSITPGIADKQQHAAFVISGHFLSTWSTAVMFNEI